jgi:hypothetical protein
VGQLAKIPWSSNEYLLPYPMGSWAQPTRWVSTCKYPKTHCTPRKLTNFAVGQLAKIFTVNS